MARVLVACEFSGRVRNAFRSRGHDAWSCDLLPCESTPKWHIQAPVETVLKDSWDLMVAHPLCTYLTRAGIGYFNKSKYGDRAVERSIDRDLAIDFFLDLYNCQIPRVAIENPVGHMNGLLKSSQIIQPYYFGDSEVKPTCLWLRNIPLLVRTSNMNKPRPTAINTRKPSKNYKGGEQKARYFVYTCMGKNRGHIRSVTFQGIADAMAQQWGTYLDSLGI